MKSTRTSACLVVLFFSLTSKADFFPPYWFAVPHLDPHPILGWPVPPAFPPLVPGQAWPGDGVFPDSEYDVVGPMTALFHRGNDGLVSPCPWAWEDYIDLDPYLNVNPFINIVVDASNFGGPTVAILNVPLVPGPDIYIRTIQPDQGSAGETGVFWKGLINLTSMNLGWAVAVSESPFIAADPFGKKIEFLGNHALDLNWPEIASGFYWWEIWTDVNGLRIVQVPEPSAVSLWALSVVAVALIRRRASGS